MVRSLNAHSWKALLAIAVVSAGLLWHMLACTESPMSFSPTGDLAFVAQEPYGIENLALAGPTCYRLMVLAKDGDLRVLDQSVDWMLTAPSFSPDGKSLCYLRVRLLEPNEAAAVKELMNSRNRMFTTLSEQSRSTHWTDQTPTTQPEAPWPAYLGKTANDQFTGGPMAPAELVVRDLKSGAVTKTIALQVPAMSYAEHANDMNGYLPYFYLLTKPQYTDPNTVYFACAGVIFRAALAEEHCQPFLSLGFSVAASPDGKTLAGFHKGGISFINLQRETVLVKFINKDVSFSGLSWGDNQTLAVLQAPHDGKDGNDNTATMQLIKTDGNVAREIQIPLNDYKTRGGAMGELAIAPDGQHMCISYGNPVLFLDGSGKVLLRLQNDDSVYLAQPTFTPDSKQIAFKKFTDATASKKTDMKRAVGIVFYSADGKPGQEVPIAPIKPGTTRPAVIPEIQPASAPATQP